MKPSKSAPKTKLERIVTPLAFGGLAVTAVALMWPTQANLRIDGPARRADIVEIRPSPEPEPAITVAEEEEPAPVAAVAPEADVVAEEEPVAGDRPIVAIAHLDTETDFAAQARQALERGDLQSAFTSTRMQLFSDEPTSELLMDIARIGRRLGELAIAEQALLDAGALDPNDAEIQIELARLHITTRSYDEARMAARQAIRLDSNDAMAWNLAGRAAMAQSHWHRAEAAFRRSVTLEPTHPMLHNNLGLLYVRMKKGDEAVDALETAAELFEDAVPYFVYNNLGLAYEMTEDLEDARDAFEQALAANPMYARARLNLDRLVNEIEEREEEEALAMEDRVEDELADLEEDAAPKIAAGQID